MSSPANILFIMSDQHHPRMTGYRGHPHVQTPHLDRLAREGAHFTQACCTNPICTPSRMSMITGQYTHRIGVPNNGFPLDRDIMTWPRRLDRAGVEATMLGKLDLCGEYQDAGFTRHRIIRRRPVHPAMSAEPPYRLTEPFRERLPGASRFWRPVSRALRHAGPRTSQILCRERFITNEVDGENDDFIGNYDHDIIVTDWAVDYLREKGAAAQAGQSMQPWALYVGLILPHEPFTIPAEYYDRLFFKKCSYEGSVGVPLAMRGPGIPAGTRIEAPVDLVDVYPTLLDAVGIAPEPNLPGASWLPLLRGERPPARDFAFAEYHGYFVNHDWFMVVHDDLKYTWYSDGERPTLFDLAVDPREMHDVAADPAYASRLQACHKRLLSVCDPEAESRRAKEQLGLVGPDGRPLAEGVV